MEYDTGTYTTELINDNLTLSDGSTKEGYIYTTELTISGRYRLGRRGERGFSDSRESSVSFLPVSYGLAAREEREGGALHLAQTSRPETLEGAFETYHYTYDVSYDAALTTATAVYTDLTIDRKTVAATRNARIRDRRQIRPISTTNRSSLPCAGSTSPPSRPSAPSTR